MVPLRFLVLGSLLAALVGCSGRRTVVVTQRLPRPAEIEVEVYDPVTNGVWEGVSVRVVEGYHEWSGCTCPAGNPDLWQLTDRDGRVLFLAGDLADAEIGFLEDTAGQAVINGDRREDEAFVLIEIDAVGFDRVFVDVPLSWEVPAVFVSVPFSANSTPATAGGELVGEQRRQPSLQLGAPRVGVGGDRRAVAVDQDRTWQ